MSDDLARIAQLERELADTKARLSTDPQFRIGELVGAVARIETKLGVLSEDMHAVWERVQESKEAAQDARAAVQHVGTLVVEQHEQTRRMISRLPCHPDGGNGASRCGHADTDPAPPLELVR